MRTLILSAIAAASVATPALAQTGAPFTGPRVEAIVGYDHLSDGSGGTSDSRDGVTYGAGVGYDVQLGGAVIGAEAELTDSSVKSRSYDVFAPGDRFRVDAGRDIYVGARIGAPLSPSTLLYAKAGYTNARVNAEYDNGAAVFRDHQDLDGYRLGAGLEYRVGPRVYVKGEYRYSHYGHVDNYDIDVDRHQVVAGVGVRF